MTIQQTVLEQCVHSGWIGVCSVHGAGGMLVPCLFFGQSVSRQLDEATVGAQDLLNLLARRCGEGRASVLVRRVDLGAKL